MSGYLGNQNMTGFQSRTYPTGHFARAAVRRYHEDLWHSSRTCSRACAVFTLVFTLVIVVSQLWLRLSALGFC
jgi:hypothetical protein